MDVSISQACMTPVCRSSKAAISGFARSKIAQGPYRQPGLAGKIRQERRQRRDVSGMAIDDQHTPEAMAFNAAQQAEQHGTIGRDIKCERAAHRHVMLGHADPQGRCHHAAPRLCPPGGEAAHAFAEIGINPDGKMRPVLLHRANRQDNQRISLGEPVQLRRREFFPHHAGHQYCTFRSTYRNWMAVSAITMTMSTTLCAAEPPRSPPERPSENTL